MTKVRTTASLFIEMPFRLFPAMEKDTGAKIIIRGKGSVKEGKVGRKDGQPLPGEDEPLHAYVTALDPESVKKAVARINEVIQQGVDVPEGQNDLRRNQLRELALLNGTLREGDGGKSMFLCSIIIYQTILFCILIKLKYLAYCSIYMQFLVQICQ